MVGGLFQCGPNRGHTHMRENGHTQRRSPEVSSRSVRSASLQVWVHANAAWCASSQMNWTSFSARSLSGFVMSDSWGRNLASISSRISTDLRLRSRLYTAAPSMCGLCGWSLSLYWIMFVPRMPSAPRSGEFRDFQQRDSLTSASHRFSTPLW